MRSWHNILKTGAFVQFVFAVPRLKFGGPFRVPHCGAVAGPKNMDVNHISQGRANIQPLNTLVIMALYCLQVILMATKLVQDCNLRGVTRNSLLTMPISVMANCLTLSEISALNTLSSTSLREDTSGSLLILQGCSGFYCPLVPAHALVGPTPTTVLDSKVALTHFLL